MAGGSGDTKDSGAKQDGGDKPASGLPRWAQLSILLLALIFLGFGIWLLVNSQAIVGSANDRNFHNLEVAANGLETWPRDAQTLAANNFNKTRWEDVRGDAPADAFKMVSFNHPQLGRFRIYYLPAAKCDPAPTDPTPASKAAPAPRAPAKSGEEAAGDDFRVFELGRFAGQGPVFQIRQKFATDQGMIDALDAEAKGKAVADANGRLCFQVGVSLDRLIALDRAAPNFSNLLILAADGSVIKQVGKTALPVSKLEKFTPGDALTKSLIQQLTTGKAQDKPADSAAIPLDAVQQAVDLTIADVDYVAYVRPFVLEGRPAACPVTTRKDGTDFGDGSKCYAVALMPKASLRNAWLSPPSALLASFGLLVLIVLALLPLVRLLLIGSTETAGPLEMAGIVLGLQTAAAVATLAILFAADLAEQRTAAQNESTHLAETLAASADGEIKDAIVKMLGIASSPRNAWTDYCWSPKNCGKLAGPQGVVTWQPRPELGLLAPYLPPLWSITYVDGSDSDKRGRPVDGTFTLAATQRMTPRINVRWRDYFIAYTGGRARPLPDLSHRHDLRPEVRANAALLQHTLGQVRSQSDGVNKTILTIGPFAPPARLSFPGERKSAMTDGALVSPLILRTFLSPILPAPHRFLVVDTSQPNLPVLFHSEPERACIDQLGEQVDIDGPVRQALRFPKSSRLVTFMARYDGVLTRFNAVRIGDTDWAVVTFYTLDEVDKIAGGRVAWTLASWGSLAILGMLLFVIWLWLGRGTWRALWPHEKAAPAYRLLSRNLLIAAVAMTAIVWLLPPLYGVFGATLLWVVTIALVGSLALIRPAAMSIKPETERAYRRLVMAMLLCCAAVPMAAIWRDAGVLVAVRADGDRLAAAKTSAEKRQIEGLAIQRSYRDDAKPMPLFGAVLSSPGMVAGPSRLDKTPPSFSTFFWTLSTGLSPGALRHCQAGTADWAWGCWYRWNAAEEAAVPASSGPANAGPASSGNAAAQITTSLTTFGVTPHAGALPGLGNGFVLFAAYLGLLALACLSLMIVAVHLCLKAATGFGVPLGAVNWPRLALEPDEMPESKGHSAIQLLGRKSLLVAPQQAVREKLLASPPNVTDLADLPATAANAQAGAAEPTPSRAPSFVVDFADPAWTPADPQARAAKPAPSFRKVRRIIFMGLELVLRDTERRRIALKMLEDANRDVENTSDSQLIIIAEMSPLERILDAFEFEYVDDDGKDKMREELRWARLFHDYTTFSFAPIDKVDESVLLKRLKALRKQARRRTLAFERATRKLQRTRAAQTHADGPARWIARLRSVLVGHVQTADGAEAPPKAPGEKSIRSGSEIAAIDTLVREVRWLPGRVIDGIIGEEQSSKITGPGPYPLPQKAYRDHYTLPIIEWAKSIRPPSQAAAIDFMRSNIIEYYEQCWVSSTFAERFVLDALAHGRFVNMTRALALQSLVRRGLVVLDPAPRLMNQSFALFVRQTERPSRMKQWKDKQPPSTWSSARLPLLIVLPVIVIAFAAAVAETGQSLPALFSLLAAGAPALLAALINSFARKS